MPQNCVNAVVQASVGGEAAGIVKCSVPPSHGPVVLREAAPPSETHETRDGTTEHRRIRVPWRTETKEQLIVLC